jgi:hypothetical protein
MPRSEASAAGGGPLAGLPPAVFSENELGAICCFSRALTAVTSS